MQFFEFNIDIDVIFVDYVQDFNSTLIDRTCWMQSKSGSIPKKLVNLTKIVMLHNIENSEATVTIWERMNRIFKLASGVRQGDAMSALLFNIAVYKSNVGL